MKNVDRSYKALFSPIFVVVVVVVVVIVKRWGQLSHVRWMQGGCRGEELHSNNVLIFILECSTAG